MTIGPTWSQRQQELAPSVDQLMRKPWVENAVGLCERQFRTLEERKLFPRRTKLAPNGTAVGWSKLEVLAWVRARLAARDALKVAEQYDAEAREAEAGEEVEADEEEAE